MCDRYPECLGRTASFVPGRNTKDGRRTWRPLCPAGLAGGCGGELIDSELLVHEPRPVRKPLVRDRHGIVRPLKPRRF